MEVIDLTFNKSFNSRADLAVCIGFFDGVHKLHEKILNKTKRIAKKHNLGFSIITFDNKVKDYLNKKDNKIMDWKTKIDIFGEKFDPDFVFIIRVNDEMIKITAEAFEDYLLNNLNVKKIVVGSDFSYGHKKSGNIETIKLAFGKKNVFVFKRVKKISSTKLREYIEQKNYKKVKKISKNIIN